MLTFQVAVGDLRTGKITTRLPVTGGQWQQTPLNTAGTITGVTVDAAAQSLTGVDLYHATAPAKSFLAVLYGTTVLAAGPIWTRQYVRSTAALTLGGAGLWSLFDHRLVIPVLTQPVTVGAVQAAETTYPTSSNMSVGDIAAALVQQAINDVGGSLPLVMPTAQGQTPGATRTYPGYDLSSLGQMLTNLTGVLGGPEIRLTPRIKATDPTSIEWVMEVGSPAQPQLVQPGADRIFDLAATQSQVAELTYDEDATTMGTRAYVPGVGSQAGMMLGEADSTTLTSVGYPLLEVVDRNHTTDSNQTDLTNYAAQSLTATNRPSTVWKLTIRNDGLTPLGSFATGDTATVNVGADPFLSPGQRRARITLIEGDLDTGLQSTITLASLAAEV